MRRTILAIVKADTREFVTIEVCDTAAELAEAHAGIRAGYTCEVFELSEREITGDAEPDPAPAANGRPPAHRLVFTDRQARPATWRTACGEPAPLEQTTSVEANITCPSCLAMDDRPPAADYRLAELDAQHDAWEKWAAEHDSEELPAGWYRDDMEDAHKAGWETGRAYRGPVDTGTTAPPCGFCGEPRHWTAEDDRRVAAIEQEDRAAPWRLLPPGYVIPGFTPPVRPICGHATLTPDGYAADCDAPAAYARPFTEHSEEYACAKHTDTAEVGR